MFDIGVDNSDYIVLYKFGNVTKFSFESSSLLHRMLCIDLFRYLQSAHFVIIIFEFGVIDVMAQSIMVFEIKTFCKRGDL